MLEVLVHRSFLGSRSLVFFSVAFFALFPHVIAGQSLINGQTFTNGLAVIDSPSPSNPGHAGSTITIAVDVSGNGKLQQPASLPGSGLPTSYDSLEIYLVSVQANINMTVSAGPAFLNSESGSTVKHLNWPIPTCISDGNYNLTFYESSHFNGQGVFAITAIPIPISNPNPSGQCPGLNPVQAQPQPSSPLSQSPFAPNSSLAPGSASGSSASPLPLSITATKTGMITVVGPTAVTLTLTVSGGVIDLPTVTVTAQPTPSTVVLISVATVTKTDQGIVTTFTQTSTLTTVVAAPTGQQDTSGFIPVNGGSHFPISTSWHLFFGAWTLSCVLTGMY